jgi:hypothetical protein
MTRWFVSSSWFCDGSSKIRPIYPAHWKESEEVAKKVLLEGFRLPSVKNALVFSCGLCQTTVGQTTSGQIWETHFLCGQNMIIKLDELLNSARTWLEQHLPKVSAETLGWLAVVVIHCATIPTLLALLTGLSLIQCPIWT